MKINPAAVHVSQIEVYEDSRALLKANGGTVIPFSEYDNALGTAIIEVATTTGSPPGISGSGSIAIIRFSSISRGQSIISFEATRFRDPENNPIAITEAVQTIIDVR